MTVEELIEELKKYDTKTEVQTYVWEENSITDVWFDDEIVFIG